MTNRQETLAICEETARKLIHDRDSLLVVAKRVYAELDNHYDCETHVDGGHKEYPFCGVGELMHTLRAVIERAERP